MCLGSLIIVKGSKQEPSSLNLASRDQVPWTSPQATTLDLYWLSIASKYVVGTTIRLVVHQNIGCRGITKAMGQQQRFFPLHDASWSQSP